MNTIKIFFSLAIVFITFSCNKNINDFSTLKKSPFSPNSISQFYSINVNNDTRIVTNNGAIINIEAGSFVSIFSQIRLEIKEAYTIADMVNQGLTTVGEKGILKTGGMFYLNTIEIAKLVKPINIQVPTAKVDTTMKLFKGSKEKDNNILWGNEEKIFTDSMPMNAFELKGKQLYNNSLCNSCHNIENKGTGPALVNKTKTRSPQYLYEWIKNNEAMKASGHCKSVEITKEFGGTAMTVFDWQTENDIKAIIAYLDYETKRLKVPTTEKILTENEKKSEDSCVSYLLALSKYEYDLTLKENLLKEKQALITASAGYTNIDTSFRFPNNDSTNPKPKENIALEAKSQYYSVSITSVGWFNIDVFLDDPNSKATNSILKIKGNYETNINLFFIIPSLKVVINGMYLKEDQYTFSKYFGEPLQIPQNQQAYLLAYAETDGKFQYFIKSISTNGDINETIVLEKDGIYNFKKEMALYDWNKLDINTKAINKEQLEKIDTQLEIINNNSTNLEMLKPKNTICENCFRDTTFAKK